MLVALLSCSLGTFPQVSCEANADCREAFGWGWTCESDGLCGEVTVQNRCETLPDDLFRNKADYVDSIVLGSVYDRDAFPLEVQSIQLAVQQANDELGLDGRDFGLVSCDSYEDSDYDDRDQETANVELATWLADEVGVPAIVGPATSGRTEAAFLAVEPFGTFMISPSATSPALSALDPSEPSDENPGLLWRTAPPDDLQGLAIAEDMGARARGKVMLAYQEGPYGEGLATVFLDATDLETDERSFSSDNGRDAIVTEIAGGDYDEVLFISSERSDFVAFLIGAAAAGGFEGEDPCRNVQKKSYVPEPGGVCIFLPDGAYDASILEEAASASSLFHQIRGSRPASADVDDEVFTLFKTAFASAYDEDATSSGFTAYAYDAAWLTVYGTAWSAYQTGEITGKGIAQGLRQVSDPDIDDDDQLYIQALNWPEVRTTFEEGDAINVRGASGALDYDPDTEETSAPIEIWKVTDEQDGFEAIYEVEP